MLLKYPFKMSTSTSYIARDIDRVEECVRLFFNIREVDRQMIAAKIIETYGAYDPAIPYEGYWTTIITTLSPEDRCLVARHLREGDSTNRGFSDAARTPPVFKLHLAAVKAEWLRLQDEKEPMCTYCGCDPNVEDHLHDCESLPCNQGYEEEEEDHPHPCKYCDGTYGEHHRDCEMVKSDHM